MKHIRGLDFLRAFAVLFVLVDHWGPFPAENTLTGAIFRLVVPSGLTAVNFFFVLSGFLITSILFTARDNDEASRWGIIKNFIIRRMLRIFPIYYLTLIILFFVNYPELREHFSYYLWYGANVLIYSHDKWNYLSHLWSLSVEEQFYLFWPIVIVFVSKKYLKHTLIASILLGVVSTFYIFKIAHGFNSILMTSCLDAFGMGALLAYARRDAARLMKFERVLRYIVPFALGVYIFWRVAPFVGHIEHANFLARTVTSILAVAVINAVIKNENPSIARILDNKALNYIGVISYGIYLYHYPIGVIYDLKVQPWLQANASMLDSFIFMYIMKTGVTLIVSHLSYKYFEKPVVQLKKRFEYNVPAKPALPSVGRAATVN